MEVKEARLAGIGLRRNVRDRTGSAHRCGLAAQCLARSALRPKRTPTPVRRPWN